MSELHLFDLDGTIIDTDKLHYAAYADTLLEYGIVLDWSTFEKAINYVQLDELLNSFRIIDHVAFRARKNKTLAIYASTATFIPGAKEYLTTLLDSGQTVVVVTNTSQEIVNAFKEALPLLKRIDNWIVRKDYEKPKPDPECYLLAKTRFHTNDHVRIIGYENTIAGYEAIRHVADVIYIVAQPGALAYDQLAQNKLNFISSFVI